MSGGYTPRVLIVEDEYMIAQDVARHFASKGSHIVGFAPSVRRACEIISKEPSIDVAVLDVTLADADCYEVADLVRKRGGSIVFYTAAEPSRLPERFKDTPVVQKPASMEQLYLAVLSACTEQKRPSSLS